MTKGFEELRGEINILSRRMDELPARLERRIRIAADRMEQEATAVLTALGADAGQP